MSLSIVSPWFRLVRGLKRFSGRQNPSSTLANDSEILTLNLSSIHRWGGAGCFNVLTLNLYKKSTNLKGNWLKILLIRFFFSLFQTYLKILSDSVADPDPDPVFLGHSDPDPGKYHIRAQIFSLIII